MLGYTQLVSMTFYQRQEHLFLSILELVVPKQLWDIEGEEVGLFFVALSFAVPNASTYVE